MSAAPCLIARPAACALLVLAVAAPAHAGVHYQAVTRTTDAQSRSHEVQVEAWVAGERARVEFHASDSPIAKSGTYLITRDGGRTLYLVNPEDKTYFQWSIEGMLGMLGGIMNGGLGPLLKIEFSDPKVEKLLEEGGGAVVGLPTRHYRYRTSYALKVKVFGFGRVTDVVSEQDLWVTDRLQDQGLGIWLRSEPPATGNADFDKLVAAGREKLHGFPLKSVTVNTSTQKDKQTVTRSTMEVTDLSTAAVPEARFEIPAGYQERQAPASRPGGG
jgi:Domain of unknown function (DUF4412)